MASIGEGMPLIV